mmetsp:Transcript_94599/g.276475  ORF Transcript_94599/g.276475 Transcript_94599/m.276475 type:complete len:212 (-) Transcript_94599:455-1090(-)
MGRRRDRTLLELALLAGVQLHVARLLQADPGDAPKLLEQPGSDISQAPPHAAPRRPLPLLLPLRVQRADAECPLGATRAVRQARGDRLAGGQPLPQAPSHLSVSNSFAPRGRAHAKQQRGARGHGGRGGASAHLAPLPYLDSRGGEVQRERGALQGRQDTADRRLLGRNSQAGREHPRRVASTDESSHYGLRFGRETQLWTVQPYRVGRRC